MHALVDCVKRLAASDRVAEAYARLGNAYALRPNDRHPIVELDWSQWRNYASVEMAKDPDKNLEQRLLLAKSALELETDYTPWIDLSEPFGTVMVPEAFGCPISWKDGAPPWSSPIITEPGQVSSIRKPRLSEAKMIRDIKRHVDYGLKVTDGAIPMMIIDMQSPLSAACQMWAWESLMTACFTHPRDVHRFLEIVTEFSIEFLQDYMSWFGNALFPGRNFPSIPENIGINIADDTAAIMFSPEQYEEFALPHNIQVAKAFNGLSVHSCGDYGHQLDNLMKIPNLKAIQCHVGPGEMPAEPLVDKVKDRVAVWWDWNDLAKAHYRDGKHLATEYTLPYLRRFGVGLIIQGLGGSDAQEKRENYRWLADSFGVTDRLGQGSGLAPVCTEGGGMKTRSIRYLDRGGLEIIEIDVPDPGLGEVQVRAAACGICRWDVNTYKIGAADQWAAPPGHEGVGYIEKLGRDVRGLSEGDRVANGSFAGLMNIPAHSIHKIPPSTIPDEYWIVEPASCIVNGLDTARLLPGDRTAVVGSGFIGLMFVQVLAHSFVERTIALDIDQSKLVLAQQFGASETYDPSASDFSGVVDELRALEIDKVFDCTGTQQGLDLSTKLSKIGGLLSLSGWIRDEVRFSGSAWHMGGYTVVNSSPLARIRDPFPATMRLMQRGIIDLAPLVTDVVTLDQYAPLMRKSLAGGRAPTSRASSN